MIFPLSSVTTNFSYHLRKMSEMRQKYPNVFNHLQTTSPVSTCVFYHLRKKAGEGVRFENFRFGAGSGSWHSHSWLCKADYTTNGQPGSDLLVGRQFGPGSSCKESKGGTA
jgi:hypothetical protein